MEFTSLLQIWFFMCGENDVERIPGVASVGERPKYEFN